jgi:hypothetical protein
MGSPPEKVGATADDGTRPSGSSLAAPRTRVNPVLIYFPYFAIQLDAQAGLNPSRSHW